MGIIFIFVDGLGIGAKDYKNNPMLRLNNNTLINLINNSKISVPTKVDLDVSGIPQSATGQTTILTGINASKVENRHISGFPTNTLKKILLSNNIFTALKIKGYRVTNTNMFRSYYLKKYAKTFKGSVTTLSTLYSKTSFRTESDMVYKKAVYQDITNASLIDQGYNLKIISPKEAGKRIVEINDNYDFTFFEYFKTDFAGHSQEMKNCIEVLNELSCFLKSIINNMDLDSNLLIITSDHGNIEDISIKTHTYNMVPTIVIGKGNYIILEMVQSIENILPAVLKYYDSFY